MDPAAFTLVRIASGAVVLAAISAVARRGRPASGSWRGGAGVFGLAEGFSFAYVSLPAGVGAGCSSSAPFRRP